MNSNYICESVEKACINAGASQVNARNAGIKAADDWKKGNYGKLTKMIDAAIKESIKLTKKDKKGLK